MVLAAFCIGDVTTRELGRASLTIMLGVSESEYRKANCARTVSGYIVLTEKGIRRIPPHSPLIRIRNQVAVYDSSEEIASVDLRTAVRRERPSTIASLVENQMQTLQTFLRSGRDLTSSKRDSYRRDGQ